MTKRQLPEQMGMKAEAKKKLMDAIVSAMNAGLGWDEIHMAVSNAYDAEFAKPRKVAAKRNAT